jgi:hypothetical protein
VPAGSLRQLAYLLDSTMNKEPRVSSFHLFHHPLLSFLIPDIIGPSGKRYRNRMSGHRGYRGPQWDPWWSTHCRCHYEYGYRWYMAAINGSTQSPSKLLRAWPIRNLRNQIQDVVLLNTVYDNCISFGVLVHYYF